MRTSLALVALLVGAAHVTGCLSGKPVGESKASPSGSAALGSFTVSSEVLGNQVVAPVACTAGDREYFLGADFASLDGGLVIRLVVDPLDGPAVRIFAADAQFDRSVVFRRSECATFHFSLDSTGWRINEVNDYRLTLELDCSRSGESIKGSASTTHCH